MSKGDSSGERLQEILRIFEEAAQEPQAERAAFVARACGDDTEARKAVEEMLDADARNTSFLDEPVIKHEEESDGSGAKASRSELHGRTIGPYRLLQRIGQGGMGAVYLAVRDDKAFTRRVVIKLVRAGMESEDLNRRLEIERQILAGLDHPNIARIYDGGTTEEGLPYFVMEYIDGERIDTYCDRNRLSVHERIGLFMKICSAVQSAHQNLVVHRDLKPSNIMVTAEGEPKLLDFGIAKLLNPEMIGSQVEPTVTWNRMLTPHYASPEQMRGQMITTASDVYSLGVLLYQLLTGLLPFRFADRSPREIERIFAEQEPERPSLVADGRRSGTRVGSEDGTTEDAAHQRSSTPRELARQLGGDLDSILLKTLREAPRQRYASVSHLAEDLQRHLDGLPVRARQGNWSYKAGKFVRRNRRAVTLAALFVGFVLAVSAVMAVMLKRVAYQRDQVTVERNLAREERDRAELERRKKEVFLEWILELFRNSDPRVSDEDHARVTVRQVLDRSAGTIAQEGSENPDLQAELLMAIGVIYGNLGLYAPATEQIDKALKIRQALFGDKNVDVARTEGALAMILREQGKGELERAVELAAGATGKLAGLVGRSHPEYLAALNAHVSALCYSSDYRTAEPLAQEAVILSRKLGTSDRQLAFAINNLSTAKLALGEYSAAADLYSQSLELRRSLYGSTSVWLVGPLRNLGIARRQLGQLEAASAAYREALSIQEQVLGEDHLDLFPTYFNLARLEQARGRFDEAVSLFDRSAEIRRQIGRENDSNLLLINLRQEEVRIERGEARDAERRLRVLLAHWGKLRAAADDPLLATGESLLGLAMSRGGAGDEAEKLLVGSFEKLLVRGRHRHQREALERLGQHLEKHGRNSEIGEYRVRLEAVSDEAVR